MKCWAGWSKSWYQDFWEKFQQPQICRRHHPYGRKWRGAKKPIDEGEKADLKLNIQKTKIMASGLITSWEIDGQPMETVTYFIFLGSNITADGDCGHEIKRCLLLARKAMTNLDSILNKQTNKQKTDITLPTKIHIVKAMFLFLFFSCSHVQM